MVIDGPGGPVGGSAAQQVARAELAHRAYRRAGPSPLARLWHWLGDRWADLLSGGAGGHALLVLAVLLLAAGVVVVVRTGVPRRVAKTPGPAADPLAPVAARDHRRLAREFAAQGRHAQALREWLRTAIATIEERGVLAPRPGRTGAATAREAGPLLPGAAAALEAATAAFDEVWFGGRDATAADVAQAQAAADAVTTGRIPTGRIPTGRIPTGRIPTGEDVAAGLAVPR